MCECERVPHTLVGQVVLICSPGGPYHKYERYAYKELTCTFDPYILILDGRMDENITGELGSCKSIKCIEGKFKQRAIRPWAKLFY